MVPMNRTGFIQELSKRLDYSLEFCTRIMDILDEHFFFRSKNRDLIVAEFIQKLDICEEEAIRVYDMAILIVKEEIKDKLKHPFGK